MANIALLGGGIECLPIIQRAIALGHQAIVIDGNPDAPGMKLAAVPVVASCYHAEQVLPALGYALNHHGIKLDAILCAGTDCPHVAAAVASAYGLPGLTPEAARLSVDKGAQKEALYAAGLPVPDFIYLRGDDYNDLARGVDMACFNWRAAVIKPADSRGARGVTLVKSPYRVDLPGAIRDAQAQDSQRRALAEEYLPGPQLSTESIVVDGRVLFTAVALRNYDRLAEFAPHIIENGIDNWMPAHDTTGTWRDNLLREIDNLITRACAAMNWRTLTVKGDLIIHENRVVILELAARLSGGFFSTHFIPLAFGVPIVDYAIRLALGETVEAPTWKHEQFVCQRYAFPLAADIGRRVVSVPRILEHHDQPVLGYGVGLLEQIADNPPMTTYKGLADIAHATYAIHAGDVIQPVISHGQRWGQAIAVGSTPEQARQRAEAAILAMKNAVILE